MTQWLPTSLKGQTTLVLITGMLAVLIAGAVVSSITLLDADTHSEGDIADRIVTLAAVADKLPPTVRRRVVATTRDLGLKARLGDNGKDVQIVPDAFTERLRERLASELAPLGIKILTVGHAERGENGPPHFWAHRGPIVARLRLSDGARLEFSRTGHFSLLLLFAQTGPILLVVGGGLTALAVWAARRVTQPLDRFAAAATRLGTDVRAPLLEEAGPREVREAASAFNVTQRRIRRLLEDRTRMLAAIAHDLGTPIMRLRLRAEFLDDEEQRDKMERDLSEMEAMISATVAFAREETREEPHAEFDMAGLLDDIQAGFVETGQRVRVEGPEELSFEGRRGALKRALANLIDNAIKYGGYADVSLSVTESHLIVSIEDGGPGIPEPELEQVFMPFYRVERSRSRETGGVGLGLAVARTVARGHGGEITLVNRPQGGLRQTVTLPRPDSHAST